MSVTYGFYNSQNGDRVYTAEQFSSFLDGIVYDGVYGAYGEVFRVRVNGSEWQLIVGTGRAWLDHTWTLNDSNLYLIPEAADMLLDRIDAVVLEINKQNRENLIKVITGTAAVNPKKPTLTKDSNVKQYPIAYVTIPAQSTVLLQENIENVVGSSELPLCSALSLSGVPSGGSVGQVLAKSSSMSGAVGWYNVTQLPTEDWMHPNGVVDEDIIAAFRFKGANSESAALQNINNTATNYTLTKSSSSVTWSAASGFFIPKIQGAGLINTALNGKSMGTVAIKFSGASTDKTSNNEFTHIGLITKSTNYTLLLRLNGTIHVDNTYTDGSGTFGGGRLGKDSGTPLVLYGGDFYKTSSLSSGITDGILSGSFSGSASIWYNGVKCAVTNTIGTGTNDGKSYKTTWSKSGSTLATPCIFGHTNESDGENSRMGSYYIHAAIIYNRVLSDTELAALHTLMAGI